ncbi:hypothetical protein QLQ09_24250 [Brucella sp. NM4]|uniref:hypothetical protein n=1 Tax=Brucella sp. NM4 TaxID=3045175 RepID=UPI0024BCE322|nr:hypothetical protein [Brucella sp. NM4]WHS33939.1 hypothetical protein QLQ09_24250 [Brucella sp. NM4]
MFGHNQNNVKLFLGMTMDGIEGVSPDGTVAGLFTPETNNAALIYLRRLIGCTFDKIWTQGGPTATAGGGSCNDVNDILAQLIAVINWGDARGHCCRRDLSHFRLAQRYRE